MRIERRFVVLVLSKPEAQTWDFSSYRGWWNVAEFVKVADEAGFQFTAQDYEDAVNKVLSEKHAAGARLAEPDRMPCVLLWD